MKRCIPILTAFCCLITALVLYTPNTSIVKRSETEHNSSVKRSSRWADSDTVPPYLKSRSQTERTNIRKFIATYEKTSKPSAELIEEGIKLAKARKKYLAKIAKFDPEIALQKSLRFDEWLALPEEVRIHAERPFSATSSYDVLPFCSPDQHKNPNLFGRDSARLFNRKATITFGHRKNTLSKSDLVAHGVDLGDFIVLADTAVRLLEPQEIGAARTLFPESARGIHIDPISGERASGDLVAVIGGHLHGFASTDTLATLNDTLAEIDTSLAPDTRPLVEALNESDDPVEPAVLVQKAQVAASAWTETTKNILFIRVEFPDIGSSTPFSQQDLTTKLNEVSSQINTMSYGITEFANVTVTNQVFTLPSNRTHYEGIEDINHTGSYKLIDDAIALAEVANYDMSNYDIVGVSFPFTSFNYRGLAGGSRQWLNGNVNNGTITHEFGHNYGLRHSASWDTTDGSVMGTGNHNEYGDVFDMMGASYSYPNGHFSVHGKNRLNWIPDSKMIISDGSTATHRIYRQDHINAISNNALGIKIQSGTSEELFLSFRRAFTSNSDLSNGLYFQWNWHSDEAPRYLDMTPDTSANPHADKLDGALAIGETFVDPSGFLRITPLQVGGTAPNEWIDVLIGTNGNDSPTASINTSSGSARVPTNFSATVSDPDGDPIVSYSWDFGDGSALGSGPTPSHTYVTGGTYTVTLTVRDDQGGIASTQKQLTITDPISQWTKSGYTGTDDFLEFTTSEHIFVGLLAPAGTSLPLQIVSTIDYQTFWTSPNIGERYVDVAHYNGTFYVCGFYWDNNAWKGLIKESTDGKTWTTTYTTNEELRGITVSGTTVIATGDSGVVVRKYANGSWHTVASTYPNDIDDVAGNGTRLLGFDNNYGTRAIFTSDDTGISWTTHNHGVSFYSADYQVAWVNDRFYLSGRYGIYESANGISWAPCELPAQFKSGNLNRVERASLAYGGGLYVGEAKDFNATNEDWIIVSLDGTNFSSTAHPATSEINGIEFQENRFVTAGDGGEIHTSDLLSNNSAPTIDINLSAGALFMGADFNITATTNDADGDTLTVFWEVDSAAPLQIGASAVGNFGSVGQQTIKAWVCDGKGGVAVDEVTIIVINPLSSWSSETPVTASTLKDVSSNGSNIVAVGQHTTVFSKDGGETWTSATVGTDVALYGCYVDDNYAYAVGNRWNGSWEACIYRSSDYTTWTPLTVPNSNLTMRAITKAGNGNFVAVGDDGLVFTSSNGTNWTSRTSGTGSDLLAVAATSNNTFITVGQNGIALRSTNNGVSWAAPNILNTTNWYEAAVTAGNDVVIGGVHSGFDKADQNANNWSDSSPARINKYLYALAYGNGTYIAAGATTWETSSDDEVWFSTNGINWTDLSLPPGQNAWRGACYSDGRFFIVGANGAILKSNLTLPSGYQTFAVSNMSGTTNLLPENDNDGDGYSNLIEYAFGSDPADRTSLPQMGTATALANGDATFTITKPSGATGIRYIVETSTDLSTWTTTGVNLDLDNASTYRVRVTGGGQRRFFRARIVVE